MRTLLVMVVVMLASAGCRHARYRSQVVVPQTPEGLSCFRECLVVYTTCLSGDDRNALACAAFETECRRTCPGAVNPDGSPALVAAQLPQVPPPEAPPARPQLGDRKCIASELPEWQGASAAEKKALLDRCRGEPGSAGVP